jgi:hypothetical protein
MGKQQIEVGALVDFQYRAWMQGAPLVRGSGTVIAETVIGTRPGFVIKPADGTDCVHVCCSGVWVQ